MIPNIKQVPYIDPSPWPNEIHMGFFTGVIRRDEYFFDVDNPVPAKLQPYETALKNAVAKEDQDYMISRKSTQTEQIAKADEERDALLNQLLSMVETMAKMAALPTKQQAAQTMKQLLDVYKPSTKSALRDESTEIQQWHQAYSANLMQEHAAQELGLTTVIASLVEKNNLVIQLMDERAQERAYKAAIELRADREATDEAYHQYIQMLNALALVDNDEERFYVLTNALTEDQVEWKERYEENRRNNRRVSVKSTVVGNKRYSTSNGWTWARLAEENPKSLAVNEDANRIDSTDTKAVKAGGLSVALNGVLVKPTDDIDVLKDYFLIPSEEVTPVTPE